MDIQKAFTFHFEDREWVNKLGLGALLAAVPLLNFAWTGYMVEIVRNVRDGSVQPLPAWDDIGKKFSEGLMLGLAGLVYALPVFLLLGIPLSALIFSGLLSGSENLRDLSGILAGAGGLLFPLIGCAAVIYGLLMALIQPAIFLIYSRSGTFASCFDFRRITEIISRNSGPYLTVWGLSVAAGLVVGLVVSIVGGLVGWVPCIGWIATLVLSLGSTVYISSIFSHLVGQFGAETGQ